MRSCRPGRIPKAASPEAARSAFRCSRSPGATRRGAGARAAGPAGPDCTVCLPAARGSGRNEPHPEGRAPIRGDPMPTYIMLSTLTPEGVQTVKNNPQRIREVNNEVEQLGATVKAQWATLGHVDFISIIEAR